jgi:lipopolysaccharide transport system permease protein
MNSTDSALPILRIEPAARWTWPSFDELWAYRELIGFLIWRDIKVRYKQTSLGIGWAVLQPVLTMTLFSVVFGRVAKLPSDGVPYPLFTFAALLPWQMFAGGVTNAANSLVGNSGLLTKVYFPRLIVPVAAVSATVVDFAISFSVLLLMMAWYRVPLTAAILMLPAFVLLALVTAFAAGLWLSAINVRFRDVQYALPFLMQSWLLLSPVAYSASLVPANGWRVLYGLNPLVAVIEGFRWALLGARPPTAFIVPSLVSTTVMAVGGLAYFRRMEDSFADVV